MARRRIKQEPAKCSCNHAADTPEWANKRGRHSGITTRGGAGHGNPFTRKGSCIHSELQHTTRAASKKVTVNRLRLQ